MTRQPLPDPASPDPILADLERRGIRLGLDVMRRLLAALGEPQLAVPSVIVGGTNGKGSTAALLASIFAAAGYRTGLYTSPHLERPEERLRLDGRPVAPGRLADLLQRVLAAAPEGALPTYFEAVTAAAFLHFAERGAEVAVLEVGLGGRLDATNAAEPILSLLTSISLEHRQQLGATLGAIAGEKAGILRRGRGALAWVEEAEAYAVVAAQAAALGASLRAADREVRLAARQERGWDGQRLRLETARYTYELELGLLGAHQAANAGLAVRAAEELAALGFPRLDPPAVARGVRAARWPGRLEPVVLPDGRRVLLDAAHNPDGAAALARFLAGRAEPYDLLFGALADKQVEAMLPPLASAARGVILTRPPSPRAADPEALAGALAHPRVRAVAEPDAALALALAGHPRLLVVCGSIYLVGAVRALLRGAFGVPAPP